MSAAKKSTVQGLRLALTLAASLTALSVAAMPKLPLAKNGTIVAFGDSLTYGHGAPYSQSYPAKLQLYTGYKVINAGLNRDTAWGGKTRIKEVVKQYHPDVVLINIGANDTRNGQGGHLKQDLSDIVWYLKEQQIFVVLIAEPKPRFPLAYLFGVKDSEVYKEVAKEQGVMLIPYVFTKHMYNLRLKADTIHLNAEGYDLVARDVAGQLRLRGVISPP